MIEVEIEADAWTAALPDAERLARAAAEAVLNSPSPSWAGGGADDGPLAPHPALAALAPPSPGRGGRSDVVILLTDDAAIQALNREHRGKDGPTNVLSFPAAASAAPHLGDIALAFETCAREAEGQGKALADHLTHLVAHGALHLLGWDHQTEAEAEAMEAHERAILLSLGKPDPYRERDIPLHG